MPCGGATVFALIQPLVWGGLAYTMGAILEYLRWPVLVGGVLQWHEMLHVAVLIGLSCHWVFTYQIADGNVQPRALDYSTSAT